MIEGMNTLAAEQVSRRTLLFQALAGLGAWVAPLCAQAQASDALKIGFLNHYPPFSFKDKDGVQKGFDLDVMVRVCQILGVAFVPEVDGMASLKQKIQTGQISWIGHQLLATPENRREFDLVKPSYAAIQLVCVQQEDDDRDFLSLDDLVGKKLGVLANTGIEEQSRQAIGKSTVAYPRIEDALADLARKKLDAVLEESLIADYFIERDRLPLRLAAPFAAPIAAGLAVRKGHREMQAQLSSAIQTLLKDGSLRKIAEKWFGYDVSRPRVSHQQSN
ncbi:transporter substrate-binding domain-containing protein [Limnohabitans sp. T6-5]|uniref:transporter substrate-binding domain-containing protein n=1 Tax=Limnohabitans sp. T6-5 TaxID=1100724 RepID=UPI001E591EA8|nr:transporter substrate-binding domain-containing protein [Limnohabitans sp. T6-5]